MRIFFETSLILLGALLVSVQAADDGQRERAFVRALELFDAAKSPQDYHQVAEVLESVLSDGYRNGAVYYNLGNAYFRAGEYGRAILNYRKARPYRPRDPYLKANLEQALATAPGRLTESPRPWWTHVLFWTDWMSYPAKVQLSFAGLTLGALLTVVAYSFQWLRWKLPIIVLVLMSLAVGLDATLATIELFGSSRGVITAETIARKGIGDSYEAAFDQPLRDGAEFEVLSETRGWTLGHFKGIGDGWIRNESIAR